MDFKLLFTKFLNLFHCNNKNYDLKTAKSLCFLGYGYRIGDLLTASFIFREIKKSVPDIIVTVAVEPQYMEFVSSNKYVDKIEELPTKSFSLFRFLRKNKFDVIINLPWDRYSKISMLFYRLSQSKAFIFEKFKYDYEFVNFPLVWEKHEHITQLLTKVVNLFGNKFVDIDYELSLPEKYNKLSFDFINKDFDDKKILLLNPEAFDNTRSLSDKKINDIVDKILNEYKKIKIVLLSYKRQYNFISNKDVIVYKTTNIFDSAYLIKNVDFVLTVDTAIVHIADFYKKKMIVLYSDDKFSIENNFVRFCSINPNTIHIKAEKDKTLNEINVDIIVSALKNIID
jgi:ADP-heptose:LPS heptosyltransferase